MLDVVFIYKVLLCWERERERTFKQLYITSETCAVKSGLHVSTCLHGLTKSIMDNLVKSTKEILWWIEKSEICIECTWNDCKFSKSSSLRSLNNVKPN